MPLAPATSTPIQYEGVSPSGSMVAGGGLQTGTTVVTGTSYAVLDGDCIISWAPTAAATLVMPANRIFRGKWVTVYNLSTTSTIQISATAASPANGFVVPTTGHAMLQTTDGSTWYSLTTAQTLGTSSTSTTLTLALVGTVVTLPAMTAPAGRTITGGGYYFSSTILAPSFTTLANGYNPSNLSQWIVSIIVTQVALSGTLTGYITYI